LPSWRGSERHGRIANRLFCGHNLRFIGTTSGDRKLQQELGRAAKNAECGTAVVRRRDGETVPFFTLHKSRTLA
jgi:hypothetical protein